MIGYHLSWASTLPLLEAFESQNVVSDTFVKKRNGKITYTLTGHVLGINKHNLSDLVIIM